MIEQIVQNYEGSYDGGATVGDNGGNEYRRGQSFTLSQARDLSAIALELVSFNGTPSGTITLRIETDDGGGEGTSLPTGNLADANLTVAYNPSTPGWEKVSFATSAILSAGKYWIVLNCVDQANDTGWVFTVDTTSTAYTGGHAAYTLNAGAWVAQSGSDINFRVYANVDQIQPSLFFGCNF